MTERVKKTLEFLREQFEALEYFRQNPSQKNYRFEHSVRVANIAAQIARTEGMDEELMTIAGLLHDVGYGQISPMIMTGTTTAGTAPGSPVRFWKVWDWTKKR